MKISYSQAQKKNRQARKKSYSSSNGNTFWWKLKEEVNGFEYQTIIGIASSQKDIALTATVSSAPLVYSIRLVYPNAKRPRFIEDLLKESIPWTIGGFPITGGIKFLSGKEGGEVLIDLIKSSERTFPLIVISQSERRMTESSAMIGIASDFYGIAHVIGIDDEVSWQITEKLGNFGPALMEQ